MSYEHRWRRPSDAMPTEGSRVVWTDTTGRETEGTYEGVWLMDNGMYIYYTPTMWRYA